MIHEIILALITGKNQFRFPEGVDKLEITRTGNNLP
jgi:hypothetical protein